MPDDLKSGAERARRNQEATDGADERAGARTIVTACDMRSLLREVAFKVRSRSDLKHRISISTELPPGWRIPEGSAGAVTAIVSQLIANSLMHAHPAGVAGKVDIDGRLDADGGLTIEVVDDGVGFPEGMDPALAARGGLQRVRNLAETIGGRLAFESGPLGASVQLILPAK